MRSCSSSRGTISASSAVPNSALWRMFIFGRTGVDLFFVLSGYLITRILLANTGSPSYFATFYGRRSFRILPIYFVMLAIYLIGRQLGGSAPILFGGPLPWWSYVIGLQNVWMAIEQSYGAAWLAGTWSLAHRRAVLSDLPAGGLLRVIAEPSAFSDRAFGAVSGRAPHRLRPRRRTRLLRADAAAGGHPRDRRADRVAGVFGSISGRSPDFPDRVLVERLLLPGLRLGDRNSTFNMAAWGHSYLVALYGSTVFMVLDHRGAPQLAFLRSRPAAFFARISYALYLTHGYVLISGLPCGEIQSHGPTWHGAALTISRFCDLHRNLRRELSVHRGAADQDGSSEIQLRQAAKSSSDALATATLMPARSRDCGNAHTTQRRQHPLRQLPSAARPRSLLPNNQ